MVFNNNGKSVAASKIMSEILAASFANFYQNISIVRPLRITPEFLIRDWPLKKMLARTVTHDFIPQIDLENGLSKMIAG